jgi:hypothetical protein
MISLVGFLTRSDGEKLRADNRFHSPLTELTLARGIEVETDPNFDHAV